MKLREEKIGQGVNRLRTIAAGLVSGIMVTGATLGTAWAAPDNTAPTLEIQNVTIASTYPFDLKRMIVKAGDAEDSQLGSDDVVVTNKSGFTEGKDKPKYSVYNEVRDYTVEFSLTDSGGKTTKATGTVTVVPKRHLERSHSSANVLGRDTKYGNTPTESNVAFPADQRTPYEFKLKYVDDETKEPVSGLNLWFERNSEIIDGNKGKFFTTDANGEIGFSMTREELAAYSVADQPNKHYLTGYDAATHMRYLQIFEKFNYSPHLVAIYDSTPGLPIEKAHYIYPDGSTQNFNIGLWGEKQNLVKFNAIDTVYEIEEGSDFYTGPQRKQEEVDKAQTNLKKLVDSYSYLKNSGTKENPDYQWTIILSGNDAPMYRVASGSVDTSTPGEYQLTLQAGPFADWIWQDNEMGLRSYAEDTVKVRVVPKPVVNFKQLLPDGSTKAESSVKVSRNTVVSQPGFPTVNTEEKGHVFKGWFKDESFTQPFDFTTPITADTTVYGQWAAVAKYTVAFDTRGGNVIPSQQVKAGSPAQEPENPIKEGHAFIAWYLNGHQYDFATPVKSDITLTAEWDQILYNVTYRYDDGVTPDGNRQVLHGKQAENIAPPVRDGYKFIGWFKDGQPYDFSTSVTGDITLTGQWEKITTKPGGDPGAKPGGDPGAKPGGDPGAKPGGDPGAKPGGDPGTKPDDDPGTKPGTPSPNPTNSGTDNAISSTSAKKLAHTGTAAAGGIAGVVLLLATGLAFVRLRHWDRK
ncbi:InlB B-repeat-containing protein [Actinotignum timonense]|uniref:InlB B-repeat-containing protein n=1 Tax=Actinotignum timonense TaxID=1870995 RepID=UPI00254CED1F|nr:InlB B-repeat-containing protein [Actinotignum timonense]MDK6589863.1 InlB B-repeat-containing protein [Actinotignum timonense]